MASFKLFFYIGLIFSPIAGIMAFLISYEEYAHHYSDRKKPFKLSLSAAIMAFIVFMLISAGLGVFFRTFH